MRLGRVILVWLLTALVLSLLAALLVLRTSTGEARLPFISAAALLLSSFAGAISFGAAGQARRRWLTGALYGMVLAVIVLMIGFLVAAERMSARGLLLVLVCCVSGGICGMLLRGGEKKQRQKNRFAFARPKR